MELVAAEPLVQSPVAAAFDDDGNLYVAEMRDYPYKPRPGKTPLGTVRLLRDTDGDGRFDAEPRLRRRPALGRRASRRWKGGVFVAAPPDIWYLKDTDGDHRADVRRKVFTGFGTQNQQAMLNNLTWGLDHKIYGVDVGQRRRRSGRPTTRTRRASRSTAQRLPLRPGDRGLRAGHRQRSSSATRSTTGATGSSADESQPLSQPVLPRRRPGAEPVSARSPRRSQNIAGRLGADLPDQPDRALAADPLEPADRPQRAVGRIGRAPAITSSTPARA